MNEMKRRAIVWDMIERKAFRPESPGKWLSLYAKTLHKLLGMEPRWDRLGQNDEVIFPFLALKCCYFIESASKYSIAFVSESSDCPRGQFHVDSCFLSKSSLQTFADNDKYPRHQIGELARDVEAVLDGMLFHPRCHAHLKCLGIPHVKFDEESGGLPPHEVRIGGGIENPYVFLFHLRYQFCLVSDQVRIAERQRLIDLFQRKIRGKEDVSAKDLFDF